MQAPVSSKPTLYLVCSSAAVDRLRVLVAAWDAGLAVTPVHSKEDLATIRPQPGDRLTCFNTGLIIPGDLLARFTLPSVNFHAASPAYPGRDPHHWAIYRGETRYGVTAHIMNDKVDAGPVLAVDWFDIPPGCGAQQLRSLATEALFGLFARMLPFSAQTISEHQWNGKSITRRSTLAMCDFTGLDQDEIERRRRAFEGFPFAGG